MPSKADEQLGPSGRCPVWPLADEKIQKGHGDS